MGTSYVVFAYATVTGFGYDATGLGCGTDPAAVMGGAGIPAVVAGPDAAGWGSVEAPRRDGGRNTTGPGRPAGGGYAVKAGESEPGGDWSRYQQWMAYCPDRAHPVAGQVGRVIHPLTQAQPGFAKMY